MQRTSEMQNYVSMAQKNPPAQPTKKMKLFYVLIFLFILGMLYGALLLQSEGANILSGISTINDTYVADKSSQSVFVTFIDSLTSASIFLGISFLVGFSSIGQPAAMVTVFARGLGIGSCMGYLYLNYGAKGVGYSALLILPAAVLSTFALILSARESVRMSNLLLSGFFRETTKQSKQALKLYLSKHLILFLFVLASAVLDCLLTFAFAGLFRLQG